MTLIEKAIRQTFQGPENVGLRRAVRRQLAMGLPLVDLKQTIAFTSLGARRLDVLAWTVEKIQQVGT